MRRWGNSAQRDKREYDACMRMCSQVEAGVYLGSEVVARDKETLDERGIRAVINAAAGHTKNFFEGQGIYYLPLALDDLPVEEITAVLYDCFDFMQAAHEAGHSVLLHCNHGVSRSPAIATAWLMWRHNMAYEAAFNVVKSCRHIADPNPGFVVQLQQWEKRLPGRSDNGAIGAYLVLPLRNSHHLVHAAKSQELTSKGLDTRGAYVIRNPSCAYVWVGSKAKPELVEKARQFAWHLGKYEQVPMPPIELPQGHETEDFMRTLPELGNGSVATRHPSLDLDLGEHTGEKIVTADSEPCANEREGTFSLWSDGKPQLYMYPDEEYLGKEYDAEDLDSSKAFILIRPRPGSKFIFRVWLGQSFECPEGGCETIAQRVAHLVGIPDNEYEVRVERELEESDEFFQEFDGG